MNQVETNAGVRNKTLRFFKQGGEWYADVPGHTLAQNRMVAGADTLIEGFAQGGNDVEVVMSADIGDPDAYQMKLKRIEHDAWGATYLAHITGHLLPRSAWLCNVTHDVFGGEHPKTIYIHCIKA